METSKNSASIASSGDTAEFSIHIDFSTGEHWKKKKNQLRGQYKESTFLVFPSWGCQY